MGCHQSKPGQAVVDCMVDHPPPPSLLHDKINPCSVGNTIDLEVSKRCWETPTIVDGLPSGFVQLQLAPFSVPIPKDNSRTIVLYEDSSHSDQPRRIVAVLVLPDPNKLRIQIYACIPQTSSQRAAGEHQGIPIYPFAIAQSTQNHGGRQFVLTTIADHVVFSSELYGKVHASASARASSRARFVIQRQGVTCAFVQENQQGWRRWKCQVGPGIDPALIICFVASYCKFFQASTTAFDAAPISGASDW